MRSQNLNHWTPHLTVRLTVLGTIMIIAGLFIVAFLEYPSLHEEIKFTAAITAAAAAIYSAYHAGTTLRINLYRDKQKQAYEILNSFNKADTVEVRVVIGNDIKTGMEPGIAFKAIAGDKTKQANVRLLLGILEDMAIAIETGYADETVLFRSLQFVAVHYFDGLKPYIDGVRREKTNPEFYTDLERLVSHWRSGQSILTKERFKS